MLKKLRKIVLCLVLLTLYFNIGWGIGYYHHYNIFTQTFESASWHAKVFAGHCSAFQKSTHEINLSKKDGPLVREIIGSIVWPIILLLALLSWIIHVIYWLLVFIFAGGLFKLIFGLS